MKRKIEKALSRTPGLKARAIAAQLDEDRSAVNSALYANPELFFQDSDYQWFLLSQRELRVEFGAGKWLTAADFERAVLAAGSPLEPPQKR